METDPSAKTSSPEIDSDKLVGEVREIIKQGICCPFCNEQILWTPTPATRQEIYETLLAGKVWRKTRMDDRCSAKGKKETPFSQWIGIRSDSTLYNMSFVLNETHRVIPNEIIEACHQEITRLREEVRALLERALSSPEEVSALSRFLQYVNLDNPPGTEPLGIVQVLERVKEARAKAGKALIPDEHSEYRP